MPAPLFKGSFPVTISEETNFTNNGAYEVKRVRAYSLSTVVTPSIGSGLNSGGQTLSLTSFSVTRKDGLAIVTETFTGSDTTAPEVYEVVASVQEEPIEIHPAFTIATGIYGSSIVSAAGAVVTEGTGEVGNVVFNEDGAFVGFTKNANNKLFGVASYLSPRVSYKRTYSSSSVPSAGSNVAYIYTTPEGSPPSVGNRNWLLTALSWQNNGDRNNASGQYEITEEYLSSGLNKWNSVIYPTA